MKNLKFVAYREDKYYVIQCLNVDVSSFGETIDEAIQNLKEAVELYFEGGSRTWISRAKQSVGWIKRARVCPPERMVETLRFFHPT